MIPTRDRAQLLPPNTTYMQQSHILVPFTNDVLFDDVP
jgi:hypothetical protein